MMFTMRPALLRDEEAVGHRVGHVPGAQQVVAHHGAEALRGDHGRGARELAAGVVHQDVHLAEALLDGAQHGVDGLGLADVAGALVHLDAQRLELGGGLEQRLGAAAADGHLGAQPAQLLGHQEADARATARHDSDVTLEQTRSENALHASSQ
jgi:hypothetical protein